MHVIYFIVLNQLCIYVLHRKFACFVFAIVYGVLGITSKMDVPNCSQPFFPSIIGEFTLLIPPYYLLRCILSHASLVFSNMI